MNARERNDLIISYVTITLAFAWVLTRFNLAEFVIAIPVVAITVGLGFILHEMAHRAMAKRYGCHAEYRAWGLGLAFAIFLALATGFVFAAPGAVYIYGQHISRKQNGIISYAGPLTNIILGALFLALGMLFPKEGIIHLISLYGVGVNFFLAFFNLIPFPPLDGSKVFAWNKALWAITFVGLIAAIFVFRF